MTESKRCPRCGGRLPESDLLGIGCARCMLELGYEKKPQSSNDNDAADAFLPTSIGRYRILRVISEGGMGTVYEAEQEQPHRAVALKIIKRGIASAELLWRFELETEALGRLQHPGIAHIYEAGTVDTGFGPQPYFAMELINGLQPREFAELHHLDTRQRTELMIKICDAVHHAHQRGLIHRDLKPANILVDEAGQPKILDFGVVRATDSDTRSTTDIEIGQLIGTLPYMSPEQASEDPLELDTRTDVYSLGIIFYELLTGRLPYTVSRKIHEAIQTIRETDPEKISTVNRSYRGDIETIVGTALEKDKTRRYQSAFGLAIDLRRYLNDEPIAARPPSVGYQVRKFTRRHKALAMGVASVFIVLVAAVIVSTTLLVQLRQANADTKLEASRADEEASEAKAQNEALSYILLLARFSPTPKEGLAAAPGLKALIDETAKSLNEEQYKKRPRLEAAVRELFASMYTTLGSVGASRDQLEIAVTLRRREMGDADPHTLDATISLAVAYDRLKMYSKAEDLAKKVVIDSRRTRGDVEIYIRSAVLILNDAYRFSTNSGQPGPLQTEQFLKDDVINYQRGKFGERNSAVQNAERVLLELYTDYLPSKYANAEALAKEIVDERRRGLGEGDPATIDAEKQLVSLYLIAQPQPKNAEGVVFLKELANKQRKTLGDSDPRTQATINILVDFYLRETLPSYIEVETFLKNVVAETRTRLGSDSLATKNASVALANIYFKQRRYKEAADVLTPYATDAAVEDAMGHPLTLLEQIAVPDAGVGDTFSVHSYGGKPTVLSDAMLRIAHLERPTIVDILDHLAQIHDKQANALEAQLMKNKLRAVLSAVLNSTRGSGAWRFSRPLKCMGVMAIRYIEDDRLVDADEMLNTVMEGYKQVAGQSYNAPEVATLVTSAALTYSGKGNDRKAEELLMAIVKIDEVSGSRAYTLSNSLGRLAYWYMDRGRHEDARKISDRLKEMGIASNGSGRSSTYRWPIIRSGNYDISGFIPN